MASDRFVFVSINNAILAISLFPILSPDQDSGHATDSGKTFH